MSNEEENQVNHTVIFSHLMFNLHDGDYIDDELVLDILDAVMDNHFDDLKGLDKNSNIEE